MKLLVNSAASLTVFAALLFSPAQGEEERGRFGSILNQLPVSSLRMVSTIPSNGDLNPYGVAFVPEDIREGGPLQSGDILVSNFNDMTNTQGTGTTIVRFHGAGPVSVFFQGSPGLGLTTALGVLRRGFVLAGNLPTVGGVAQQGSLLVIDRSGNLVTTLADASLLNGPWDLTVNDEGDRAQIFVSNVLSGTVTRLDVTVDHQGSFHLAAATQIASGYLIRTDPAALVVGPTGLAYDQNRDLLYVASTGDNAIFAIPHAGRTHKDAGMGRLVYQDATHLHGPLGLALAPNGHLIASNGDAVNPDTSHLNELVEFTAQGKFVAQFQLDPGGAGGAFGLAIAGGHDDLTLAAVDDNTNMLDIWNLP